MNKIRIRKIVTFILILIASFVILNINVKSVTADGKGACSGHGGVACSIGPDTDGSVVCNDGYRDSSVRYDDVAKCAINSNDDSTHNTPSSSKNINNNTKTTTTNKNEESIPIHALLFGGLFGICLFSKSIYILRSKRESNSISKTKDQNNVLKSSNDVLCPLCGSKMVVRNGRYGLFYGCSRYPYCKGTRNINDIY